MAKVEPRVPMREQPPKERIKNFNEVPFGYSVEEAQREAARCLQCKNPKCVEGCPVEVNIPAFIKLIREGDFRGAIRKIKETNLLPAICGRVCPQETQCEAHCVLGKKHEPVAIGRLERFVADWEREHGVEMPQCAPPTGKKIAVVGSGPAGLTVASDMAKLGYEVTVFEALHAPGGVLIYGIPEFRLPKAIVRAEVEGLQKMGVKFVYDYPIGRVETIDDLLTRFDAVFIGVGAGAPMFMNIPGENLMGIYSANEYLTRSNLMRAYDFPETDTPIVRGKKVAVIGGGNVAMDSARTALRLGAESVTVVYRRTRKEMPARAEEVHHAEEEGVQFSFLTNPVAYHGDEKGWVREMECIKMRLGEPDASGRPRPIPIEGSNFRIPVDLVIVAIGTRANPVIQQTTPGLEVNRRGYIKVLSEETMATTKRGVFAGGDIVTGAATVISAMGAGRRAARAMHAWLCGELKIW
ncbi:MAG: glutamate synthase (NADPH), homotetrameric [Planctomycetota bacterium]|nr:MAG: glutamate synthase (NADPH), homotetrameric [Planctomycetota bacterium]